MAKPIALAADHGGFELKEAVKAHLKELGLEYIDFGTIAPTAWITPIWPCPPAMQL